jgi:LacI family transcriptional regulator
MSDRVRTLKELAERLDMSVATVSRALAGHTRISPVTRARVSEAARRYGYEPNRAARALVSGRSGFVGLVLPTRPPGMPDPFLGDFLVGLSAGLARHGSDVFLAAVPEGRTELEVIRNIVETRRADGLVLARTTEADPRIAYLLEHDFPFVTHGRVLQECMAHNWVDTDGATAFGEAFDMLYDLGHRHVALVTIEEPMTFRRLREQGLAAAIARRGDPDVRLEIHASPRFDAERRTALVREMLSAAERPTGVIALFDGLALSVLAEARALGLAVPRDLSVIGFDNVSAADHAAPGLTTFDAAISDCAAELADMLVRVVTERPERPMNHLVRPRLILRESHGRAPG